MARELCDLEPGNLARLLKGLLSTPEEAALEGHLENCEGCRKALERMAAERSWWDELPGLEGAIGQDLAGGVLGTGGAVMLPPGFLEPSDEPGTLGRLGPYLVEGVLGRGGMGVVLKAFDPTLHRLVAIKLIAPELSTSGSARRRFAREARAAAAISHDHVVAIHGVAESSGGLPYLVMAYIDGRSLQERLDADGSLPVEAIVRIGMQTAAGLASAHAQGLVHRDIKPSNILLENGVERVKITDFGLARAVDDAGLSQSGVIAGTPQYMSPEQARGEPVDTRADLFSLGSVLYAMATGRSPFPAPTPLAVVRRVSEDRPRPIHETNPEVPDWLVSIIDRLLAKNPANRFQTASEVAELLGRCLAHLGDTSQAGPPFRSSKGIGKRARWAIAASTLLILSALGAAEATGVSDVAHLLGTILRIKTPEGTLVIAVDDPGVKVAVDGQNLVIGGAGVQEFKFRLGEHRVLATKDGRPVRDELVTITRDNKPTVTVHLERNIADATPIPIPGEPATTAVLQVPEWYRPGPPRQVPITSSTIVTGPEIPGLTESDALKPVPLDEASPVPLWPGSSITWQSYSPDGKTLAIASNFDRKILLFDTATRVRKATLMGHQARVWTMVFSPDGKKLVAASGHWGQSANSGEVRLWDLEKPAEVRPVVPADNQPLAFKVDAGLVVADRMPLAFTVAWSPDGRTIAFGGWDDLISFYDVAEGKVRLRAKGHADAVRMVAYSPDGKTLASAGWDRTVRLWDPATGQQIGEPLTPSPLRSGVNCVGFSPDGKLLAAVVMDPIRPEEDRSKADQILVWELATRRVVARLVGHSKTTFYVAFSPDGRTLVTSGGDKNVFGEIKLWDVATWAERASLGGFRSWVGCAAFSPDGRTLIVSADHGGQKAEVRVYQTSPPIRPARTYRTDGTPIWSIAYSPDGKTLAAAAGLWTRHGKLWLLDSKTGEAVANYPMHLGVRSLAYSRDGRRIVFGGYDGSVKVVDSESGLKDLRDPADGVTAVAITPDGGRVAAALRGGSLATWDLTPFGQPHVEVGVEGWSLAYSPDGKTLAEGRKDGSIGLLAGKKTRVFQGHKLGVAGIAFSPDGRTLASASWDRAVKLWDPASGQELATLEGHDQPIHALSFSPDGQSLASCDGSESEPGLPGRLILWDLASRTIRERFSSSSRISSIAFAPDGQAVVVAGEDGVIRSWDLTGR